MTNDLDLYLVMCAAGFKDVGVSDVVRTAYQHGESSRQDRFPSSSQPGGPKPAIKLSFSGHSCLGKHERLQKTV